MSRTISDNVCGLAFAWGLRGLKEQYWCWWPPGPELWKKKAEKNKWKWVCQLVLASLLFMASYISWKSLLEKGLLPKRKGCYGSVISIWISMWERDFSHPLSGMAFSPAQASYLPSSPPKLAQAKSYPYHISTCKIVNVKVSGSLRQTAVGSSDPD